MKTRRDSPLIHYFFLDFSPGNCSVEREVEEVADQVLRFKSHSRMVGKQLWGDAVAARDGDDTRRSQALDAPE